MSYEGLLLTSLRPVDTQIANSFKYFSADVVNLEHFKDGSLKNIVSKSITLPHDCLLLKFRENVDAKEFFFQVFLQVSSCNFDFRAEKLF